MPDFMQPKHVNFYDTSEWTLDNWNRQLCNSSKCCRIPFRSKNKSGFLRRLWSGATIKIPKQRNFFFCKSCLRKIMAFQVFYPDQYFSLKTAESTIQETFTWSLYWLHLPLHFFQNYKNFENTLEIDIFSKIFKKFVNFESIFENFVISKKCQW